MSTQRETIHVLDKANYSHHRLVDLEPKQSAPLPPSSLRLRPRILGLTTNNLTYARHGHLMGWYDIYPLPPNTPSPYIDSTTYGRIAAWGYADILDSTVEGITSGSTVYGFLPISTGTETVTVEFASHNGRKIEDQIIVTDEHRQHLWKIYNRYRICSPLSQLERSPGIDALGWDALMQGLFATGYNMSTYAFAWTDENRIHPSGKGEWGKEKADLKDATVVVLNASGKTGRAFSYCLRACRPVDQQPREIIGVGSERSVGVLKESGLYDEAVLNDAHESTTKAIEASNAKRVVLFEFGARPGAADTWADTLGSSSVPFTSIMVGGEVKVQDPEAARRRLANLHKLTLVNASLLREKGIEVSGKTYFDDFHKAWEGYRGSILGMKLEWADGMEAWREGWEAFCRDQVKADTGLVYRL